MYGKVRTNRRDFYLNTPALYHRVVPMNPPSVWELFPDPASTARQLGLCFWEDDKATRLTGLAECWRNGGRAGGAKSPSELFTSGEAASPLLKAIVDSSDDAIISKDLNGVVTSWNKGAERLFGYTAAEMIGQPITILIPMDRQDEEPHILSRLRRGERVEHFQTVRRRKDGSFLDISLTISPVKDRDDNIVGASKIARDITQQKRSDEALLASEARFRQLANAMPQMMWTATPAGDLDYVSERAIRYFDASPESVLGSGWLRWGPPDDQ